DILLSVSGILTWSPESVHHFGRHDRGRAAINQEQTNTSGINAGPGGTANARNGIRAARFRYCSFAWNLIELFRNFNF
ncbi:MAG: hypothetical protein LBL28_02055, partial [Treponema sp.]|nr:hypothetical protein [Treponema sp.]